MQYVSVFVWSRLCIFSLVIYGRTFHFHIILQHARQLCKLSNKYVTVLLLFQLLGNQYDYAAGGDGVESAGSSLLAPSAGRGHTVMFKRDIPASDHLVIHNTSQ